MSGAAEDVRDVVVGDLLELGDEEARAEGQIGGAQTVAHACLEAADLGDEAEGAVGAAGEGAQVQ